MRIGILLVAISLCSGALWVCNACAGEVKILAAKFEQKRSSWTVRVTLKHDDSGWKHYADGWRVVDEKGNQLAKRILYHPHVNEQPFTRSQANIKLDDEGIVYVEAHDNVHGWSADRVKVNLSQSEGYRFQVFR